MNAKPTARVVWGAAIAAGMVLRLVWVFVGPKAVTLDAAGYRTLALSLAEGHGYATGAGPSAFWMPGWPAWMAMLYGVGANDLGIAVVNVLLGGATVAITWTLARELAPDVPLIPWASAGMCALTPSLVLLPRLLLSENLALPLLMLAALALTVAHRTRRLRYWAAFGIAAAAATFVRESCAAVVLAGLLFTVRRHWIASVVLVSAFVVVVAPWVVRNRAQLGTTTLTTSAGVNLCIGLGDGATGGHRSLDGAEQPLAPGERDRNERGLRCAKDGLVHHPLGIVTLAPARFSRLVIWDDWIVDDFLARAASMSAAVVWALRVACDGFYWFLLACAAAGRWRHKTAVSGSLSRVALAIMASVALPAMLTFGAGRFHTPLLPLLAMLAARGVIVVDRE